MSNSEPNSSPAAYAWWNYWPWVGIAVILVGAVVQLHQQGRRWWCACGEYWPWAGDIWSKHGSQHLFDPYSFTHVLHGVAFCGLLAWGLPRLPLVWRLCLAVLLEAAWEVLENSPVVIERYRAGTIALGYEGDSIANSLADIFCCVAGFLLAARLGFWRALVFFVLVELFLLVWIRDGLLLNVLMLIYPIEAIKQWQMR